MGSTGAAFFPGPAGYNHVVMRWAERHLIEVSAARRATCGVLLAAVAALPLALAETASALHSPQATMSQADMAVAVVPVAAQDLTAAPSVTSPLSDVAAFSLCPLHDVAAVVQVIRVREVSLMRFGGLYGP
jgi:hypothetical protein